MTPERLAEIRKLLNAKPSGRSWPTAARRAIVELLADNDELSTANFRQFMALDELVRRNIAFLGTNAARLSCRASLEVPPEWIKAITLCGYEFIHKEDATCKKKEKKKKK